MLTALSKWHPSGESDKYFYFYFILFFFVRRFFRGKNGWKRFRWPLSNCDENGFFRGGRGTPFGGEAGKKGGLPGSLTGNPSLFRNPASFGLQAPVFPDVNKSHSRVINNAPRERGFREGNSVFHVCINLGPGNRKPRHEVWNSSRVTFRFFHLRKRS